MLRSTLFARIGRGTIEGKGSSELLEHAGYVEQCGRGLYDYTQLGVNALRAIEARVRRRMHDVGCQEVLMTMVQGAEAWIGSGRYESIDQTLVRFRDRHGGACVLAMTHEEEVARWAKRVMESYRQDNVAIYQIQSKFRDELRVRGGLLRTREFWMKDAYSLHLGEAESGAFYERMAEAYSGVWKDLGLKVVRVESSTGDMGGRGAEEFSVISEEGEDEIGYCEDCQRYWNSEVGRRCSVCENEGSMVRAIEVGNIFKLGTRYTKNVTVQNIDGRRQELLMNSYGIGISRLLCVMAGAMRDERGLSWDRGLGGVDVHIAVIGKGNRHESARVLHDELDEYGLRVLLEDRDVGGGEQLVESDLIGANLRITLGRNFEGGNVEIKERQSGQVHFVNISDATAWCLRWARR